MSHCPSLDRRGLIRSLAGVAAATILRPWAADASNPEPLLTRRIPSTGEELPLVGLGSWGVFNVGEDRVARDACAAVLKAFFDSGGRLIDSSPMYGSSAAVIGYGLEKLGMPKQVFAADKVWISSGRGGPGQIEESQRAWRVQRFDLLQVHNLIAWEQHLPTLYEMKRSGRLRYVGITTSHGRRHEEFEQIMRKEPLDFIQLTYNILDREVEERILPLARDRGMAVIVNRPFQRAALIQRYQGKPLPRWAEDIDCTGWPQFLLKFIVSHPAITCAIPATSKVAHAIEDMGAARGRLPDEAMRRRMIEYVRTL
jgi:diketogulonate reductase-like aldo/keto reductase